MCDEVTVSVATVFMVEYLVFYKTLHNSPDTPYLRSGVQLCTALETANQLVQATSSNAGLLSKKIEELEKIIKRGDDAVAAARAIHGNLKQKDASDLKNP